MKPRVTVVAGGGLDSGGKLEPLCFFGDVFADVAGLGWRCLSSESDIGEGRGEGGVAEGLGSPRRCIYELASNSLANSDPNARAVFTTNGQERVDGGDFLRASRIQTFGRLICELVAR